MIIIIYIINYLKLRFITFFKTSLSLCPLVPVSPLLGIIEI